MKTQATPVVHHVLRWVMTLGIVMLTAAEARADADTRRRALDAAVGKVHSELLELTALKGAHVAVIPLAGEDIAYATESIRAAVNKAGLQLFTREDGTWRALVDEIEFGVRREDVMNPQTVQRFGRIEGVDAVMFGRVWDQTTNLWSTRSSVRLSLHLADVETGEVIWSSGPVEGEAYIHWSDAVTRFWRYPAYLIAAIVIVLLITFAIARAVVVVRHANRPL